MDVSAIIVNWNTQALLARCLRSLLETTGGLAVEIIVVDNASSDNSLQMLSEQFPQARVIANSHNAGFSKANNQGAAAARGRNLLLLNSDAFLQPNALHAMQQVLEAQPAAGLVGARLLDPDGDFQASHTRFPTFGREFMILSGLGRLFHGRHYPSHAAQVERGVQRVDYVEGACMLVRPEAYAAAGGLDEAYFMYAEEVDLCYTLRCRGWEVWYQPAATVIHIGGASSGHRRPERESDLYRGRVRFFRKHYGRAAATRLAWLIVGFTLAKSIYHRAARWATGGRWGRPVAPVRSLAQLFQDV